MDARGLEPKETVPASRKLGAEEAKELAGPAQAVTVAKGKKVTEFEGGNATDELITAMLGPTGNLRAPLIRAGKQVLVGFNEEAYTEVLGA